MNPWIDETMVKTRGDLMKHMGKDLDFTDATNLFLAMGMNLYENIKSNSKELATFQENVKTLLTSQKATRFEQFTKQLPAVVLKSGA